MPKFRLLLSRLLLALPVCLIACQPQAHPPASTVTPVAVELTLTKAPASPTLG